MRNTVVTVMIVAAIMLLGLQTEMYGEVYFGDIHAHSAHSMDAGTTEDCEAEGSTETLALFFENAINAGLDFVAITDHAEGITSDDLDAMAAMAQQYESSTFIPFAGYEWTSQIYGHRTVVFKELDEGLPLYSSRSVPEIEDLWDNFTMAGLQQHVIALPHHPAGGPVVVDWNYHNSNYEPLVEIYSEFGSSEDCGDFNPIALNGCSPENTVQAALDKGYKLGIYAGTDSHDSSPGSVDSLDSCFTAANHPYAGGLIAVMARSFSRENIWRAIKAKRVYGTSGPKILLRFKLNEAFMGSTVTVSSTDTVSLEIGATADGTGAVIEKYEIIKNGAVLVTGTNFPANYTDTQFESDSYYYVRVTQRNEDGTEDRAWSSPIWVTLAE
ncbi:MAG: CehA/McbA family metallohydrolase [bacterium]|nr:CehA/McbA family metallohydrolase [bacterium]